MKVRVCLRILFYFILVLFLVPFNTQPVQAQGRWDAESLPVYLKDRGAGAPTSMFGTYVRQGEWLIYPFFEYYYQNDAEYEPAELGYSLEEDFRGKYRASEGLIFLGYGITDRLVFEMEAAIISATQYKSDNDTSTMPNKFSESGLGDVQTQLDYYWLKETASLPGTFGYLEIVYPFNKDKKLVDTGDYEIKTCIGMIKGFSWGTMTFRAAVEYVKAEKKIELGEIALEYLKRLSKTWRIYYLGVEGTQDEWELITELQIHVADWTFINLNNAFGITSKASGWFPEVGVMFSIHGH